MAGCPQLSEYSNPPLSNLGFNMKHCCTQSHTQTYSPYPNPNPELTSTLPVRLSLAPSAFLDYVVFAVCGRGAVILGSSYACSLIYSIKQYQISTIGSKTAVTNIYKAVQKDNSLQCNLNLIQS